MSFYTYELSSKFVLMFAQLAHIQNMCGLTLRHISYPHAIYHARVQALMLKAEQGMTVMRQRMMNLRSSDPGKLRTLHNSLLQLLQMEQQRTGPSRAVSVDMFTPVSTYHT